MAHIVIVGATPGGVGDSKSMLNSEMRKIRKGNSEPVYEEYVLKALGIARLADKGRS
jgi:hypothetical protein